MKKMNKKPMNESVKILFLKKALRFTAVLILKKYNPKIIGITGSVGKTSSKEAVFTVLAKHYRVRKNEKNYNNEIGIPLTIIGAMSAGKSIFGWIGVFLRAFGMLLFPIEYPEMLVLEMGADRPGDIKYLTDFISCEVAVITDISGSHLEYFKTIDKVGEEKWKLIESLKKGSFAAVNVDNSRIAKLKNLKKGEKINFLTFGFSDEADMQAKEVFYNYGNEMDEGRQEIRGLSFKLNYKGTTLPVRLNNVLAQHSIHAALSGVAMGIAFKLNLVEIASSLENFSMPSGRMNLLSGVKETSIIDDTYNSSPVSSAAAFEVMKNIKASRKIAVMGDMLELGKDSEEDHKEVARKFLKSEGDIFFAVGQRMLAAATELRRHNINENRLFIFSDPISAGRKLEKIIEKGDLILVKGSQGIRMEKVVEEIMSEPEKAEQYLCRQSADWKDKPWKQI